MTTQEQVSARQRLAAPITAGAAVLSAFAVVALVDPHEAGHYPVCPTLSLFGIYCPLCGGLRAANDLTHGDVVGAASSNLLLVLVLPFAVLAWISWVRDRAGGSMREPWLPSNRHLWIAGVVLLVFMVVRNLPFGAALAP